MKLEQALDDIFHNRDIRAVEHYASGIVDGVWLLRIDVQKYVTKIFDEHEAQLKAKDTAIELLESMCNLGLETQNKYSRIVKAKDEEIERLKVENKKYMEHITLKHLSETIVFCASCSEKIIMLKENNE